MVAVGTLAFRFTPSARKSGFSFMLCHCVGSAAVLYCCVLAKAVR